VSGTAPRHMNQCVGACQAKTKSKQSRHGVAQDLPRISLPQKFRQLRHPDRDLVRLVARKQPLVRQRLGGRSTGWLILEIKTRDRLTVLIANNEAEPLFVDGSRWRESAPVKHTHDCAHRLATSHIWRSLRPLLRPLRPRPRHIVEEREQICDPRHRAQARSWRSPSTQWLNWRLWPMPER
jgi:hypothetical protein